MIHNLHYQTEKSAIFATGVRSPVDAKGVSFGLDQRPVLADLETQCNAGPWSGRCSRLEISEPYDIKRCEPQ
jgi:hypothetical protein